MEDLAAKSHIVVFADPGGLKDSTTWDFAIANIQMVNGAVPKDFGPTHNCRNHLSFLPICD